MNVTRAADGTVTVTLTQPETNAVTAELLWTTLDKDGDTMKLWEALTAVATPEVTVQRIKLANAAPGRRDPGWLYVAVGPDGARFDNRSIVTLREVLRRKYGKALRITEPWGGAHRRAHRIDPAGCGCTDCLTGYSVPLDQATDQDLLRLVRGEAANATGETVRSRTVFTIGTRKVTTA